MNNSNKKNLDNITLSTFNCNGLRNKNTRLKTFNWLRRNYNGIILLQETHSTAADERRWRQEWRGPIYFSHCDHKSRGVAILLPRNINFKQKNTIADNNGRYILLDCEIEDTPMTIINLYCPTKDKVEEQITFLEEIKPIVEEYSEKNLLIGGDLNTYLNAHLDKRGGRYENTSEYTKQLLALCEEYTLIDIWRIRNPWIKEFTRSEKCRGGVVESRLDYWLISMGLTYLVHEIEIHTGMASDHSLIRMKLNLPNTCKRGKSYWKFNNDLLSDKTYIEKVKNIIQNIKQNTNMENKNMLWEFTLCQIRTETMQYSKSKAKKRKTTRKRITTKSGKTRKKYK